MNVDGEAFLRSNALTQTCTVFIDQERYWKHTDAYESDDHDAPVYSAELGRRKYKWKW